MAVGASPDEVLRMSPFDPVTIAGVCLLVVVVGLLACFWPARRASRFSPLSLLRQTS